MTLLRSRIFTSIPGRLSVGGRYNLLGHTSTCANALEAHIKYDHTANLYYVVVSCGCGARRVHRSRPAADLPAAERLRRKLDGPFHSTR